MTKRALTPEVAIWAVWIPWIFTAIMARCTRHFRSCFANTQPGFGVFVE